MTGSAPPQPTAVEATPEGDADDHRKLATGLHWGSLVVAFGFLFWANRDQWFDSDEWNFLVRRRLVGSREFLGIWDPHNKHWVTLPVLVYRVLFNIFGVRTYAPYLVLLLVLSLLVAHLLWRLMLRFGIDPLLATAAAAVFAFVGAGWENVTNGFQITLIAPLAVGLGAVLVVRGRELTVRRYAAVWLLLLVSVMSSGVGVTMVAVVVVITLFEHGVKAAVIVGSVPTAAYLIWFALQGRYAPAAAGEQGLWPALQATPAFLWRGLTGAVDVETGLTGAGAVLVLLLVVWTLRHADLADRAWRDATVLALGAVLFISLTAIARSGLGADNAAASRYSYIVLALLLPLAVLAVDQLLGTQATRWLAMGLGLGFLLLVSVSTVAHNADAAGIREQDQERRVLATAQLTRSNNTYLDSIPVPTYMPDLDVNAIRRLREDGKLPGDVTVTQEDVLTARTYLQLEVSGTAPSSGKPASGIPRLLRATGATAEPDTGTPGCVSVVPESDTPTVALEFENPGSATIRTEHAGNLVARLADGTTGATGRPRAFPVPSDRGQFIGLSKGGLILRLDLAGLGETELCGVTAP